MSTSQTKNKSQRSVGLTKLTTSHPAISLAPIFSKLRGHQIPDLRLRDHPFREFFIGGVQERLHQKGKTLILLKSQSPSLFPLINFLFLPDCPAHSFSLHSPYRQQGFFSFKNGDKNLIDAKLLNFKNLRLKEDIDQWFSMPVFLTCNQLVKFLH